MPSEKAWDAISIIMCLLPSISLQSCGLFSPYWIKNNATSDCYRGVVYNVDCPDNVEGLGSTVLALQGIFFTIIVFSTVLFLIMSRYYDNAKDCAKPGISLAIVYLLSGFVGLAGCLLVYENFPDHDKGWSLYVSLAASCYVILPLVILIYGGGNRSRR